MNFESMGWLGTEQEAQGAGPLDQEAQGARPLGACVLGFQAWLRAAMVALPGDVSRVCSPWRWPSPLQAFLVFPRPG
jgi:hypothetical protein